MSVATSLEYGSERIIPALRVPSKTSTAARGSSIGAPVVYVVMSEETVTVLPIVYMSIAEAASSAKKRAVQVAAFGCEAALSRPHVIVRRSRAGTRCEDTERMQFAVVIGPHLDYASQSAVGSAGFRER